MHDPAVPTARTTASEAASTKMAGARSAVDAREVAVMLAALPVHDVKAVISYRDASGVTHTAMAVRLRQRWVYASNLAGDLAQGRAYPPIHVEWSGTDEA